MSAHCPYCHTSNSVSHSTYGSPLVRCYRCDELFLDPRSQEPALCPPPKFEREKIPYVYYSGGVIAGFFMMLYGISDAIETGTGFWSNIIFGILSIICGISCIWWPFHEVEKEKKHYQELVKESHERLSVITYQEQLIKASRGSEKMIDALERYDAKHGRYIKFDVAEIMKKDL